ARGALPARAPGVADAGDLAPRGRGAVGALGERRRGDRLRPPGRGAAHLARAGGARLPDAARLGDGAGGRRRAGVARRRSARGLGRPAGAPVKGLWRTRRGRAALLVTGALLLVAALADFVASDRPLAARPRGELYLFPNVLA